MINWCFNIPEGLYTTQQFIDLTEPKQTYPAVYNMMRRLKVESYRLLPGHTSYNSRNQRVWVWKGIDHYIKNYGIKFNGKNI